MKQRFYSNGKLLLTGEYVVLDGATALALPTRFGQDLTVEPSSQQTLLWKSFDADGTIWFSDEIPLAELMSKPVKTDSIRTTLINILHEAQNLNPGFFTGGFTVETHLDFPRFWGLGTSSTLINNIAQWMQIDAFRLLHNSFGGSGYDIACAQTPSPLLYTLINGYPTVERVAFNPSFSRHLYFVYLNKKQSSKAAIASYQQIRESGIEDLIAQVTKITFDSLVAESPGVFARLLQSHEAVLSDILQMKTVGESFFPDFDGTVKSLGGWGGDFIFAVSKNDPTDYFASKGYRTVIPYSEMIL